MNKKRGRPKSITHASGWHGKPNFSAWARTVVQVGRAHGYSDTEIHQWIRVYAKKSKIPYDSTRRVLSENDVHVRAPYKISATSRASFGGKRNTIPLKIRFLGDEIYVGLRRWQLSILRTLQEAKEQGEDVSQAKREIMEPIKRDWDLTSFSKMISLEEFIKRVVPELQEAI
jgi:hypothetical protein